MTEDHIVALRDAILAAVRDGSDLGDLLAAALGRAAIELGSVQALTVARPGSWESADVRHLAAWAFPDTWEAW